MATFYRLRSGQLQIHLSQEDQQYLAEILTDRTEDDSPYKNKQLAKMWLAAIARCQPGGTIEEV